MEKVAFALVALCLLVFSFPSLEPMANWLSLHNMDAAATVPVSAPVADDVQFFGPFPAGAPASSGGSAGLLGQPVQAGLFAVPAFTTQ